MTDRRERATSFAQVVDEYERARPGYPDAAIRWMVGDEPRTVVDLGAGTGHGTVSSRRLADFRQSRRVDRKALRLLATSRSYVASLPPEGRAAVLDRVDRLVTEHPDLAGRSSYQLPYVVAAYRARKSLAG